MNRAEAVRRGNIISTCWNGEHTVGCYLGNGRFGAILSGLGLNLHPEFQKDRSFGPSHFKHMDHWGRFRFFPTTCNRKAVRITCSRCFGSTGKGILTGSVRTGNATICMTACWIRHFRPILCTASTRPHGSTG